VEHHWRDSLNQTVNCGECGAKTSADNKLRCPLKKAWVEADKENGRGTLLEAHKKLMQQMLDDCALDSFLPILGERKTVMEIQACIDILLFSQSFFSRHSVCRNERVSLKTHSCLQLRRSMVVTPADKIYSDLISFNSI
jgi:hypothetical protein